MEIIILIGMKNITGFAVGKVSSAQCWKALQAKEKAYLIDVRTPEEWQETGVADLGAIKKEVKLLSWVFLTPSIHQNSNFINDLEQLFSNREVELYFICKSGGRSMQAAEVALSLGYKKAFNVEDGFVGDKMSKSGWMNSDLPRREV
ncbi:MAG: rhodanese-like domain-containing protein [Rickettsiales bacterium]|jgi:rhodanese-related sulfurtransferase|nr:rhodanese-like domain-containing protein [Rickettsiales bacterium]